MAVHQVDRAALPGCASRAVTARRSAIREIFDAAAGRDDVIRLEIGEPSFKTPAFIVDAALRAARDGHTRYTPNGGTASLRELLAEKVRRVDGYAADPGDVVATPGAMNALFSIYFTLLDAGEEVLLPTPGFPNMDEMVRVVGGVPVFYPLDAREGFLPDPERIEALIGPRTKAIFVNTPGNPTGAVFPRALIERLVELANRRGVWLISDEVYDEMVLDDGVEHVAAAAIDPTRVISVYSFSKVYAMTGWRLGYCVAPSPVATLLRKLQEPICSCPSAVSQKAAEAALTGPADEIDAMRAAYRRRRDRAWDAAAAEGVAVFRTQGTFYMMLDVSSVALDAMTLARRLLDDHGVAIAPGSVFGPGGEGKVRISFAVEPDDVAEGVRRLGAGLRALAAEGAAA